ncbi:MAG: ankyrin repeat domain-containing protein [Eudoraea sp.]|nr:ankyrin repeat domain-containing protein [Eudoraea sp.]
MFSGFKYLILMLFLAAYSSASFGQELTAKLANNIKYGRTENLVKYAGPGTINGCRGVGNSKKYNFLAISIKLKSIKSLKFFVENGANIEGVCADKTPLMYAAKYGQLAMVKYLVEQGADPAVSIRGNRAINYARRYHHTEIVRYLKEQRLN